jgi:ArsR family transcriptional regulator
MAQAVTRASKPRRKLANASCATTEDCCPAPGPLRARDTRAHTQLFKALGDATRLELVGLLAARGKELCVCELESHFALGQPTVSHHLRVLREAGIVRAERRGTWVYYALEPGLRARLRAFEALIAR